jgi:hypothetical protein
VIALFDAIGRAIDAAPTLAAARETAAGYRANGFALIVAGDQPAPVTTAYRWLQPADIRDFDRLAALCAPTPTLRRAA